MNNSKWIMAGMGALTIAALLGGSFLFAGTGTAAAQSAELTGAITDAGDTFRGGGRGDRWDALLAEALGITENALQTAQQEAFKAAVQQALDGGLITQAQADRLLKFDRFPRLGLGMLLVGPDSGIDMDVLLASKLGISVQELQAAREKAAELGLEQAIETGMLSEKQADLLRSRRAIQGVIDFRSLAMDALGLSQDQLDSHRADGMDRDAILQELGMTEDEAKSKILDAYNAAVLQAVSNGVITQAQADLLLENLEDGFFPLFGIMRSKGRSGMQPFGAPQHGFGTGGGPMPGFGGMHGGFSGEEIPLGGTPPLTAAG